MYKWSQVLKESPVDWLLEKDSPSIRYFTLRDIHDRSEEDCQVVTARKAIAESRIVERILQRQDPRGYWEEPANPYHPKYKSSYWQVMILGQLGMDKADRRVRNACEYVFQFQLDEGGFSSYTTGRALKEYEQLLGKGKKLPPPEEWASNIVFENQYSCLTGNMSAALIRIGYSMIPE